MPDQFLPNICLEYCSQVPERNMAGHSLLPILIAVTIALLLLSVLPSLSSAKPTTTPAPEDSSVQKNATTPRPKPKAFVTFYTLPNFYGVWWTLSSSGECVDIPSFLFRKASSVNTHNNCVLLYSGEGCQWHKVQVRPGTKGHSDLKHVSFDNRLASWQPCPDDLNVKDDERNRLLVIEAIVVSTDETRSNDTTNSTSSTRRVMRDVSNSDTDKPEDRNVTLGQIIY